MQERLQKILARAGIASRRHAEELILAGRVGVNGRIVRELGSKADPAVDEVTVDGRLVPRAERPVYIMLNKPAGYVSTRVDPEERPTVYDLVPDVPGLFSVGRLDQDTEGLLLLTTDGAWAQRVAHPRYTVEREYEVHVRGPVPPGTLERLRAGIMLEGRPARPLAAFESGRSGFAGIVTIVLQEGRKREVRLLCAAADLPVQRLVRRRVGSLLLGWLATGHWRYLDAREVEALARGHREHDLSREHRMPARDRRESGWQERRTEAGESDDTHRNRRSSGLGQVHDRPPSGSRAGLPLSGHRHYVPGRDGAGDRRRDRSGG
ncbi:MAG TPA: pseudouridine synthase [Chloroflexota bacterium]|nr:pseudouridine synthase [Chloroflexota bacterium]